ncbi:MAG: hypothetical protein JXR25_09775 [Pontiellaceae bacterium]|nr:hypothetical protein [Pontiellaceae bacterium]MBN2785105.1 hypothetical protein [Pontiellaceae bacterium]
MKYDVLFLMSMIIALLPIRGLASNCPGGATSCYKKAIYERDVGAQDETSYLREFDNDAVIPDHTDFGVHRLYQGYVVDVECIGLFADSFSEAIFGAVAYLALFRLDESVGWVDGEVKSSNSSRGAVKVSDDIQELEYNLWVATLSELRGDCSYHLYNCQHFAGELYN